MAEFLTISTPAGLLQNVGQFTQHIIGHSYERGDLDRPTTEPC